MTKKEPQNLKGAKLDPAFQEGGKNPPAIPERMITNKYEICEIW